jgi:hypothetical protein
MSRVPAWLSFPWWWLLVVSFILVTVQLVAHLRLSSPAVLLFAWSVVQADWVKRADPRSRGIYWVMAAAGLYVAHFAVVLTEGPLSLGAGLTLMLYLLIYIIAMIALCKDFERLRGQSGQPVMQMTTTLMAVFVGAYYFQFHLHELAESQRAATLEG